MLPRFRLLSILVTGLALAGCARHQSLPVAVALPPAPVAYAPLPPFAGPDMVIPAVQPDGSYPTPSDHLSTPAALWHLRAALNVAALTCRNPGITAAYNNLIVRRGLALGGAQRSYAAEYRIAGTGAFDEAMTRLYNFYALYPARSGFCDAAGQVLAGIVPLADADLAAAASGALAQLDRPFTDFYAAYDAWRMRRPVATTSLALVAPATPAPGRFHRIELTGDIFAGRNEAIAH